jgi:hypothetical protein
MANGIYEAFKAAGHEAVEGTATAAELKAVESVLIVCSASRSFHVYWLDNQSPRWVLAERQVLGTLNISESYEPIDSFSSFAEAHKEARRLASGVK